MFGSSFGFAYLQDLKNDSCLVDHRGIGDVYVNTKEWFKVSIDNIGNVYYSGNPEVLSYVNGSGKLIHE